MENAPPVAPVERLVRLLFGVCHGFQLLPQMRIHQRIARIGDDSRPIAEVVANLEACAL